MSPDLLQPADGGGRRGRRFDLVDQEVFNIEAYEGADWVRISDEVPVDEDRRDRLLEEFQTHYHPGSAGSVSETALEQGDEELDGTRRDRTSAGRTSG